jgi:hypothetical protein
MRLAACLTAVLALGVSACAHGPTGTSHTRELTRPDSAFGASESRYYGIQEGETPTFETVQARNFPLDSFGGRYDIEDFRLQVTGDRLVVDTIRTGDEDDSVEAAHVRFIFHRVNDEWRFVDVLARYRCYRGRPGVWTNTLCP